MSMTTEEAIGELIFLKAKLYNGIFKDKLGCIDEAIIALEENQKFHAIGSVSEFRELKEKATEKKQGNIHDLDSHFRLSKSGFVCCGATNKEIRYPLISFNDLEYCPRCGQHLDWGEGKE